MLRGRLLQIFLCSGGASGIIFFDMLSWIYSFILLALCYKTDSGILWKNLRYEQQFSH